MTLASRRFATKHPEYAVGKTKPKTVSLNLVGLDGNAFGLLGAFQRQAKREGWTANEVKAVLDEATSGDYRHLLKTLMEHCEPTGAE